MDPFYLTGWLLVIVIAVMCFAYFRPRRKPGASLTVEQANINWPSERANMTFEKVKREVGKNPALAAPYGKRTAPPVRKPVVVLTPRQIESINIKRKLRGYPPLNRAGVKNAVAYAATKTEQPQSSNDWLLYLILWESMNSDHQSHTCSGTGGFTIDPNLPNNGAGGQFAGGGASGSWTDAPQDAASAAALISTGSHFADTDSKYQPGDTVSGYGSGSRSDDAYTPPASDPAPSYTPPAATYSPLSDSGSSYSSSSDSSSSSSSSSDSGSSGGGDSGGGGGGGGGGD